MGEVGIRFGRPSVMLLKHTHYPILENAMKLNQDKSGCYTYGCCICARKKSKNTNTFHTDLLVL